ncbi:hypothetical protein [Polluticoccus soli]|uniref:hypothetical protein n=1 Tax=Polluticoccus soli TaxID=3034150 RepID=UPI0023E33A6E|nr:hypothetical protein [Flavipsychrobacter sp. JY13-12]
MLKSSFAILFVSLIVTTGCCKKKLYCNPDGLTIIITGYPRLDVRNIIVKKYATGNHRKALDSTTFIYSGTEPIVLNKKDTLVFKDYSTTSTTISGVYQGNDWDIYLPGTPGRENYRVTSIVDAEHRFEMIRCSDHDTKCLNPIGHFVVNDNWKQGDTLWIEKKK